LRSPNEEPLRIVGAKFFTSQMPFLSPKQQCRSTEGLKTYPISEEKQLSRIGTLQIWHKIFSAVLSVADEEW